MSRIPALVALLFLSLGCAPQPVRWEAEVTRREGTLADSLRLTFASDGAAPTFRSAWRPPSWPAEPGLCVATLRSSEVIDGEVYASWFRARPDSSVILRVARSDDGGRSWNAGVDADTTDRGRAGCARPAPFIAADSLNGYVHVVYHLDAIEGSGLFFTHTMERGALFHSPVPIVYGDRPSRAAVASRGDTVAVVFEDPNSRQPRLGLALSFTQGHIFEYRVSASDEHGEALAPRVALRGARIAIAWTSAQRGGGTPRIALRLGTIDP